MVQSTSYPVYEYERKGKKRKRGRRIAVAKDNSGPVWYPAYTDFVSRVLLDSGIMEARTCTLNKVGELYNN